MAETPFVIRAGELNMLDAMNRIPYRQKAKVLNQWTKGVVSGLKAGTRGFGVAGLAVEAGVSTFNISTGHGELSDIADLAMIGIGVGVVGIVGVTTAPFVAAGGLTYGGIMVFGGEDYINNSQLGKATANFLKL